MMTAMMNTMSTPLWSNRVAATVVLSIFAWGTTLAETTVYVVRHAEKAADASGDPPLSDEGRERADALRKTLRSVPLDAVYVTQYRRTQETVAPTARLARCKPRVVKSNEMAKLASILKTSHKDESVLVAGHTFSVPELLAALGVKKRIRLDVATDYDNLFVVILGDDDKVRFINLHYGKEARKSAR